MKPKRPRLALWQPLLPNQRGLEPNRVEDPVRGASEWVSLGVRAMMAERLRAWREEARVQKTCVCMKLQSGVWYYKSLNKQTLTTVGAIYLGAVWFLLGEDESLPISETDDFLYSG